MKILSVNAGSSSLKFQMYEMPEEKVLISGVFEKIGIGNSFYTIKINGEKTKKEADLTNHEVAVNLLIEELLQNNVIDSLDDIKGVGHRMVHGGDKYSKSLVLTDEILKEVATLNELAPLHNPANISGVYAFMSKIPVAVQVGCFDTAFHQTLSEDKYRYAVPEEWYKKYGVRKYGFHGMSHKYVSEKMNTLLGKEDPKVIVCHIGNGGSISAVRNGKCIDTTMGFTPNAGIIMGSRSGDIDYGMIPFIMNKTNMSIEEVDNILNKKSGLLGISTTSSDFRDILSGIKSNDEKSILAYNMYVNAIVGYVSKYYVELEGADAICFTAGVGENNALFRKSVIDKLACLGIKLDDEKNNAMAGEEGLISTDDSKVQVYVIPTDEEVVIARDTFNLI